MAGVAAIGLVNLLVSFALSLVLALKAQQRRLWLLSGVARDVAGHLLRHPFDLVRLPRVPPAQMLPATEPPPASPSDNVAPRKHAEAVDG